MPDIRITTKEGDQVAVSKDAVEAFRVSLRGPLVAPGENGYEEARTVWNAMIDRRPALIARCASPADVVLAVRFAATHGLLLAVRGGGHNIAGKAVCDGGLMIDLTPMKAVRIDPVARTARVEPGATLGDLDHDAQTFGLATPVGINSTTGVAGLTLGGGFGWLSRRFGLTIDNLISADVVTADGRLLRANGEENADLFWAIRGGGGNFGIVTSFEFRMHEVGPTVLAGLVVHPLAAAAEVIRFYRDFILTTPEEFVCWFVLRLAPPLPFLPAEWHGKPILALAMCHSGDLKDAERVAKPLRDFGKPVGEHVGPMPFTAWQQVLDPLLTPGFRNYWKSHDFAELPDGLIDTFVRHAETIPDPMTEIACAQLGGAVERVPSEATAYSHRDGRWVMNVHGRWSDPDKDAACIAWARGLHQAAAPYATGSVYVNFLSDDDAGRVGEAYGTSIDRLIAVKKRYDPTNLFRVNQNIRPTE